MIGLLLILFANLLVTAITARIDLCGGDGVDLSLLNHGALWNLTHFEVKNITNKEQQTRYDFTINVCAPLNWLHSDCNNKYICQKTQYPNNTIQTMGFEPIKINKNTPSMQMNSVLFEGPLCEVWNINRTLEIRFTCGPHLEYPKIFWISRCHMILLWRTMAACDVRPAYNEIMCYVYDDKGKRRDLTPLIKPNGGYYKVMSADEDFYINVCSDASQICLQSNTSGACIRQETNVNSLQTVADYRWFNLTFKSKSGTIAYDHIELTYNGKSNGCPDSNSKTTIRFVCPSKRERRSILSRIPKLVSNLDCNYEVEWQSEYACPVEEIEVEANKCQLLESRHGLNFNLKSLMQKKSGEQYYKIENINLNDSKQNSNDSALSDIYLNVCGGLGNLTCGSKNWNSNAVCLKSKDGKTEKVIGSIDVGVLNYVDNRLYLKYDTKDSKCKYGDNYISETTVIEFLCDKETGVGKPEFVSFDDCIYYIIWKTSYVCYVTSPLISCSTAHKENAFDLSLLRRNPDSDAWIASVTKTLPWSRHAKSDSDHIVLNVCDRLPVNVNTSLCGEDSAACLLNDKNDLAVNLGKFSGPPVFNEDINALELLYTDGFDSRNNKQIKTKISLYCKPGNLESSPVLIDIDESEGIYEFEWHTAAACPINAVIGNNCSVYDKFLGVTFDLNQLKTINYYPIKTKDYDFHINVCGEVTNSVCNDATQLKGISGPIGACQVELNGDKRIWSLGKANYSLIYWNGIINLTFSGGTPYGNSERTPRKSHIAFICDPNIGRGHPEFDGESNRSYFFRWYTSLACPHTPKIVHCVWDNGSHILDLTPLALTQGNHYAFGKSSRNSESHVYYINICRPLNQIHGDKLKNCGPNSAVCRLTLGSNESVLSLGEPNQPPISLFDGSIGLFYTNGAKCPNNPSKNISTHIKFVCDINGDSLTPRVVEPGSEELDGEDCVYLFEYRTAAVCNVIQPTKMQLNSCGYTDSRTGLSADLSSLKMAPTSHLYEVYLTSTKSKFVLNICGIANPMASSLCTNSAVCFIGKNSNEIVSYGSVDSSLLYYDEKILRLKYSNGSTCPNSESGFMSTEIEFKCNPDAVNTLPQLHSNHKCLAVFTWETNLVCSLQVPQCSLVTDSNYYNLRQLSSLSHAWNTTDKDGNIYLLNVCAKLPSNVECNGQNTAVCKCKMDSDNNIKCDERMGDPSNHELAVTSDGTLTLTYSNGDMEVCNMRQHSQTVIRFKCAGILGRPRFVKLDVDNCVYEFEWHTFAACPVNNRDEILLLDKNGFLRDERIKSFINIKPLMNRVYYVKENRKKEDYTYVINFNKAPEEDLNKPCSKAIICQTKDNPVFERDIGSVNTIKYYIKGNEFQIILTSQDGRKCGRNKNKNVTSIIRLECSSAAGIGEPTFLYESDDCDYLFTWNTDVVCPQKFLVIPPNTDNKDKNDYDNKKDASSKSSDSDSGGRGSFWVGIVIVLLFLVTLVIVVFYKQRTRQSLMFRFRRLFTPETNQTFHYHQLATYEKDKENEVAFISCSQTDVQSVHSRTIAPHSSRHVPYSIYDDSDVDLLT